MFNWNLVQKLGLENIDWKCIIAENVKPKFVELNQKAFELGKSLTKNSKYQRYFVGRILYLNPAFQQFYNRQSSRKQDAAPTLSVYIQAFQAAQVT